jgi:hypothetical protein
MSDVGALVGLSIMPSAPTTKLQCQQLAFVPKHSGVSSLEPACSCGSAL